MTHDEVEVLAALFAAGAIAESDLPAGDPALSREVRSFDPVIAALAEAPPVAPDPQARAGLLQRVADSPPPGLFIRRAADGVWEPTADPGVTRRILHLDEAGRRVTALYRMAPGARYPGHFHTGVEECLILEGDLRVGPIVLCPGDYQRAEPGSDHDDQTSEGGCLLLLTATL